MDGRRGAMVGDRFFRLGCERPAGCDRGGRLKGIMRAEGRNGSSRHPGAAIPVVAREGGGVARRSACACIHRCAMAGGHRIHQRRKLRTAEGEADELSDEDERQARDADPCPDQPTPGA